MRHKISSSNGSDFDEGKRQGGRSGSYTKLKLEKWGRRITRKSIIGRGKNHGDATITQK